MELNFFLLLTDCSEKLWFWFEYDKHTECEILSGGNNLPQYVGNFSHYKETTLQDDVHCDTDSWLQSMYNKIIIRFKLAVLV